MATIPFIFKGTRIEPSILAKLEACFLSNTRNQILIVEPNTYDELSPSLD
jgi:hypothetical protein